MKRCRQRSRLISELAKGESSAKEKGYIDISEVEELFGLAMVKIKFTPDALEDMKEIKAYITDELCSEQSAIKTI